jgi:hypothetical protein
MESGYRSPLVDFFRRGEAAHDVRLQAAQGVLAPRAHEQLALLIFLTDDADPLISASAHATLDALPQEALVKFLARSDVPDEMRAFFASRGVAVSGPAAETADEPLVEVEDPDAAPEEAEADPKVLSTLPIMKRMKLAMKGTREQRAQLIRDSNRMVAVAVLSSSKLTEAEVEAFAKMANVSEDVLRIIASNRSWMKNYGVVFGLTRNPKTPPAISMKLLPRLNERDMKLLGMDRNVPEAVRIAARKYTVKSQHH